MRRTLCLPGFAALGVLAVLLGLPGAEAPAGGKQGGGKLRLEKEARGFHVVPGVSPIRIVRLKFHPTDPTRLLGQVTDRRLAVWDLNAPPSAKSGKGKKAGLVPATLHCEHAIGWICGFDIHPSGQWVATGGSDRHLKLWRWENGKPAASVQAHDGWVEAVAYAPDGKHLATASSDLRVRVWDAADLKLLHTFSGHTRFVRDVAWSPDSKLLISGGEDGKVLVWDVAAGKLTRELDFGNANEQQGQDPGHSGVARVACSPDGRWLGVGGHRLFTLFDLQSGNAVASDRLHFDALFYPTDTILLAGMEETKLLRLKPGRLKAPTARSRGGKKGKINLPPLAGEQFTSFRRGGYGAAFSRDGSRLAATVTETDVALWKVVRK